VTGLNFGIAQAENVIQHKSVGEKIKGFLLNFLPYKGTYDGIHELRNEEPRVKFSN
jgi:hypothetical protein